MKQIGLVKALWLVHKADRMTDEKRLDLQKRRLRELVSYAKNRSPYFAILYQDIDENTPLTALPTISKADMAAHFDEWMTDTSITKGKVEHFMEDSSNIGRKLDGKYLSTPPPAQQAIPAPFCMMLRLSMYLLPLPLPYGNVDICSWYGDHDCYFLFGLGYGIYKQDIDGCL